MLPKTAYIASKIEQSARRKPVGRFSFPGKNYFCGHCQQNLSRKTFEKHKRLFWTEHCWTTEEELKLNTGPDQDATNPLRISTGKSSKVIIECRAVYVLVWRMVQNISDLMYL